MSFTLKGRVKADRSQRPQAWRLKLGSKQV